MKLFSRSLLAVLIGLISEGLPARALADHAWGNYHWARTSNPFTLKVGNNVSNAWQEYLDDAITDWNQSTVLQTTKVAGGTRPKTCKGTKGRIEVCSERYGFNGWLGIAQIWVSGSHITQGIAKVNDSYFNTSTYNKAEWKRLVMCQEIAHAFGLDHQDENFNNGNLGTCMDYTSSPLGPPSNEHPNAHDFEQLLIIYDPSHGGHNDATTTITQTTQNGKMPPGRMDDDDSEPVELGTGQWGQLIRSTNNGRTELFELDLGGGRKVFTHVIWADPEEPGPGQGRSRR